MEDKRKLNQAILQINDLLNNHKNNEIQDKLKSIIGTEATEYRLCKPTRKLNQQQSQNSPIRTENGQLAKSNVLFS